MKCYESVIDSDNLKSNDNADNGFRLLSLRAFTKAADKKENSCGVSWLASVPSRTKWGE